MQGPTCRVLAIGSDRANIFFLLLHIDSMHVYCHHSERSIFCLCRDVHIPNILPFEGPKHHSVRISPSTANIHSYRSPVLRRSNPLFVRFRLFLFVLFLHEYAWSFFRRFDAIRKRQWLSERFEHRQAYLKNCTALTFVLSFSSWILSGELNVFRFRFSSRSSSGRCTFAGPQATDLLLVIFPAEVCWLNLSEPSKNVMEDFHSPTMERCPLFSNPLLPLGLAVSSSLSPPHLAPADYPMEVAPLRYLLAVINRLTTLNC